MLAPEAPYPIAGGGALRTASLLEYVGRRYETDLIVFREPGAPDPSDHIPRGLVRRVTAIDLPANGRSLAARALRNAARVARRIPPLVDRFSGFGTQVESDLAGRYDLGIVEHFWCAPYHAQIAPACSRTVLNLHNVESVLHARCAETENGAVGLAHRVFHQAALELEREWLPRFSEVLAVSRQDASLAHAIAPQATIRVYPNAIPLVPLPPRSSDDAIVFSGNMEYHPNIDAVRFFRAEIWPLVRDRHPALLWRLAGKNPGAISAYVAGDPRIEVVGPVTDAIAELARSRIAIVPLRAGSGTRLKIIEAWAAGLPVISTTLGAEGLPARHGENILIADTPAGFAEHVTRLFTCPDLCQKLGAAGRLLLEKEFTWESAWKMLDF